MLTLDAIPSISIDIETYGLKPNSVILSIGAVEFDFRLGKVGRGMHVNMDPDECEFYGLERDPKTVRWWNNQSPAARARTFDKTTRVNLKDALLKLNGFIQRYVEVGRSFDVYVCGPDMDISVLANAYRAVGVEIPWPFWAVRDYRTLREWFPMVPCPVKNTAPHDALADATYQAHHLIAIWNHVNGASKLQQTVDTTTDEEL